MLKLFSKFFLFLACLFWFFLRNLLKFCSAGYVPSLRKISSTQP
ncbi:hypothetical protein CAMRE0001_0708 [Campylobacter rectus RM3267]|uniref:Uncharacterized protein n=1 Tax=Campylobacter rectus RM3267 TaxID=553218 RepID=B9CZL7_CAMRE|nr:hypothetical protein CAMRE0001_0708 [Campylobacter rectus RM3267]